MIDRSYSIPLLPDASDPRSVYKANAIEENLRYLIRQWPAFEVETIREVIGGCDGVVFVPEAVSPAQGVEVTLLQHLYRLLVIVDGDVEYIDWSGDDWELMSESEGQVILAYAWAVPSEEYANNALRKLAVSATWNADLIFSLAAERPNGTLRITRPDVTRMLFRAEMIWGRLDREHKNWAELKTKTWADARKLKKE